jgi:hypothetical protein
MDWDRRESGLWTPRGLPGRGVPRPPGAFAMAPLGLGIGISPVLGGQTPPTFLLRDEFVTAEGAPITTPRTCEPGPGSLVAVQNDGQFSVSAGALQIPAQTTPVWGDLSITSQSTFARSPGLAMLIRASFDDSTGDMFIGWGAGSGVIIGGNFYPSNAILYCYPGVGTGVNIGSIAALTLYQWVVVLRSVGCFFVRDAVLLWVGVANTANLYAAVNNYSRETKVDWIRVAQLAGPWATDYGLATDQHAGNVPVSTTFTHEADCLIEFVVDALPGSGSLIVAFRRQDSANEWRIQVNSTGDLSLFEYVDSVGTNRASAAGVVAPGNRVVVIADGQTINGYSANTLRWTYSSAANFQTETDGAFVATVAPGAISDLITWPRRPSGIALAQLQRYTS